MPRCNVLSSEYCKGQTNINHFLYDHMSRFHIFNDPKIGQNVQISFFGADKNKRTRTQIHIFYLHCGDFLSPLWRFFISTVEVFFRHCLSKTVPFVDIRIFLREPIPKQLTIQQLWSLGAAGGNVCDFIFSWAGVFLP